MDGPSTLELLSVSRRDLDFSSWLLLHGWAFHISPHIGPCPDWECCGPCALKCGWGLHWQGREGWARDVAFGRPVHANTGKIIIKKTSKFHLRVGAALAGARRLGTQRRS
eukprot:1157281-Pelagomonas_calceolata.AAC.11